MTLTAYELERQVRLEENAKLLASLGLDTRSSTPSNTSRSEKKQVRKVRVDTPDRLLRPRTSRTPSTCSPNTSLYETVKSSPPVPAAVTSPAGPRKSGRDRRVVVHRNGRVYDSQYGTSCHQCRQKTMDEKQTCTIPDCRIMICFRCLPNRYGTQTSGTSGTGQGTWRCPKCRGVCNCSLCMKAKGRQPTGILAPLAFQRGFDGVAAMLASTASVSAGSGTHSHGPATNSGSGRKRKWEEEEEEEEEEYFVESIVAASLINAELYFQTRWAGYTIEDDTMEPYETVYNVAAMDAYEAAGGLVDYQDVHVPVSKALAWRACGIDMMNREFDNVVRQARGGLGRPSRGRLVGADASVQSVKMEYMNAPVSVA